MSSQGEDQTEVRPEGRDFGRYTLLYRFAAGGMADVYLGRLIGSDGFEKLVAMKLIRPELTADPKFVQMFVDEARLASRISHPNVVQVIELGRVDGVHFIAMEYIDGESVQGILKRVKPPLSYVARIVANAAGGLHAAHELKGEDGELLSVVHRDVSPGNILVGYDGTIKVSDFGVARARGRLHQTTARSIKGKFGYIAPEIALGKPVDRRADIYSLGIVLYEMSVRRRLFKADGVADAIERVLRPSITLPSSIDEEFPRQLETIILRALESDPNKRYQSAQEMQTALERYLQGCGELVLPAHVGQMMSTVFADKIGRKRELLEDSTRENAQTVADAVSLTSTKASTLVDFVRKRPVWVLVGSLALVSAVIVGIALLVWDEPTSASQRPAVRVSPVANPSSPSDSAPPQPKPDATVAAKVDAAGPRRASKPDAARPLKRAKILISVRAQPAWAKIRYGGKWVRNPLRLERPAASGEVELLISAGRKYHPRRLKVSLERGGEWEIVLRRKRRKTGKGVFSNPYQ